MLEEFCVESCLCTLVSRQLLISMGYRLSIIIPLESIMYRADSASYNLAGSESTWNIMWSCDSIMLQRSAVLLIGIWGLSATSGGVSQVKPWHVMSSWKSLVWWHRTLQISKVERNDHYKEDAHRVDEYFYRRKC